ncbi:MAG: hypothetical protein OXC81_03045 [Betaproteobacteria bacterium]|nr:hypothetical protein [Betaproteobacteria bacterium]
MQTAAMLPLAAAVLERSFPIGVDAALGMLHAAGYFALVAGAASLVRNLGLAAAIGAAGIACAADNWLLAVWLTFLIGLRMSQLLNAAGRPVMAWLVAELLLLLLLLFFGVIPRLLPAAGAAVPANLLWFVGGCWLAALALAGFVARSGRPPQVEHIAAVLFFLFTLVLALSAALLAALRILPYGPAVLVTVVIGQVFVAVFWLAWSPFLGSGLSTVFFRHVLSLGVPVDEWLAQMEEISRQRVSAADFWDSALRLLQKRLHLRGLRWSGNDEGAAVEIGQLTGHHVDLPLRDGGLRVHAERRWLPSAIFNLWMLARVASEFRQAKLREERRAAETAVRSVHEIGAKTTHDIKNILHVIRLMAKRPDNSSPERMQQLGKLAERLEESIKSLGSAAARAASGTTIAAPLWWQGVQERYCDLGIEFKSAVSIPDQQIPAELFDRALENMVHNAIRKRQGGDSLQVKVRFEQGPALEVVDNGAAVEASIVERLFAGPVPSADGMGIGLFQLAAAAAKSGWRMRLASNRKGDVRFRLEPEVK